ncbi:LCP family protein [Kitasatospora sp. NBC_00240]|uniref:LCP family protein n=1 Tax=Kitasatospora sp. NBC_00240 TaxID=2903567 RepID=UPI00224D70B8|nr:LCP family protein [Kitasatospora sp. NBC_00240]MCX5212601.1 LCP family protein [Kitasatospora sp. NBC_00240]
MQETPQEVDPADRWVLDPDTGQYRLDLAPRVPRPRAAPAGPPSDTPPPGGRAARRRGAGAARTRRRRALKWTAGAAALALVAGCGGALYLYEHFNNNITAVKVQLGDEADRPQPAGDAMNILVLGTDSREGLGSSYGDAGSTGHADTTLLFHIAKDRSNATVLSIPRDLMVPIPDCQSGDKRIPGEARAMFNTSLGQDGRDPGCSWKTVEKLTGIRIDHFVMVNFDAVKTLSTAVGGVEVCAAKDINDPDSHLRMTKGKHLVQGDEALAFVRTRHAVGLGGDLTRIPLQQQFLSSMIRAVKSGDTLTSPTKLWNLANAATKALTVDSGLNTVDRLKDLALDVSKVDTKHITFATAPVLDDPQDKNRLVLKQPDAGQLFSMVAGDRSLTDAPAPESPAAGQATAAPAPPAAGPAAAPAVDPKAVPVTVRNGTGTPGQAQKTVDRLQAAGFTRAATAANATATAASSIGYPAARAGQAAALATALGLPEAALKEDPRAGAKDPLVVVLGKDAVAAAQAAAAPGAAAAEAPKDLQRVEADDADLCAK